ncbi:PLP-dependent aminotransferase family protein [Pseudonocardia sp. MH-G8]|uniref:MocR-like pyridoxine biosynthesis transcription factor PdxR n=1 Tax=Pseudonocardia sp. MH-G8 TaxID=1854588 RepID=UPI000BA0E064|nr:PLP-dependent aminotransferase family protein [Pseudonocardia sp. MH-G8]OZM83196.1 GntR family transcriptional regulator [Pseudonocardia sp. MH-G8]
MTLLPFEWPAGEGPVHLRLAGALRAAITNGRLPPGARLPASRILAVDLQVSRWVVTEAYEQLKAEGYLAARTGSGTTVAATHRGVPDPPPGPTVHRPPATATLVDLAPNLPDLRAFPRSLWRSALTHALDTLSTRELGYPDPLGDPELRRVLADYVRRVRGVPALPSDVVITNGTTGSIGLLFRALAATGGTRVALEDPGWPQLRAAAGGARLTAVPVPVDERGLRAALLAGLDVDSVCVTPSHQFPTGVVLAPERREQVLEWAARGGLLIEDDYDAEFRYGRRPVDALASIDAENVVYLGSVSKTLAPALQIGWMVLRGRHRAAAEPFLRDHRTGPPIIDQRALAWLIASGGYDRQLRRMRRSYQARRTELRARLAEAAPGAHITGPDAGLHVLLELGAIDEQTFMAALARRGLAATALDECRIRRTGPSGVLIGYGNLPVAGMRGVATAVGAAVAEAAGRPRTPAPSPDRDQPARPSAHRR